MPSAAICSHAPAFPDTGSVSECALGTLDNHTNTLPVLTVGPFHQGNGGEDRRGS